MELKAAVEPHVASSGPYTTKVMLPVGANPPASVARSVVCPPKATGPEAWVVSVGAALSTRTDSPGLLQAAWTGALDGSPP